MNGCTPIALRLLNDYQHGFPLLPRPYAAIGDDLGIGEDEVLALLDRECERGAVSRIGAVFAPRRIGASTLAALAVPADRLDAVAAAVSARPEVNHNYEREPAGLDDFNLWFVLTAADAAALDAAIARIESATGLTVMRLPLEREYHIDLGFRLHGGRP